ncbi:hypothetical protein J5X84_37180 [Streptosporangiaceae bacterium NEAU-GS5]|nr:hypothetical protein [Streptosporangiaceae bacterium NEAU-GS5]
MPEKTARNGAKSPAAKRTAKTAPAAGDEYASPALRADTAEMALQRCLCKCGSQAGGGAGSSGGVEM